MSLHAAVAATPAVPHAAALSFEACELRGSGGRGRVAAECGRLRVPENPGAPDGPTLDLFVARLPSLSPEPAADAVTIINGGPGASSVSLYVDLEGAFSSLRRNRDVVVMDQRGTGRSAPLDCPSLEEATYEFDPAMLRKGTRACLAAMEGDPRYYTTTVAATDLEALRRALGYERWDLYGVSYGTRVAQHYLQRFPDAVRTLIIDGVVPLDLPLGPDVALNAQRTLDAILARCAGEASCAEAFPQVEDQLADLLERLRSKAVPVQIPHPRTGRPESFDLQYAQLAMSLRMLSYTPETAAMIPLIIQEAAARENYLPLAAQALLIEQSLTESISFGMHNSVVCTEDVPFYTSLEAAWPALEATYLGANQVKALQAICELWPAGVMDSSLRQPQPRAHPVLLLSGELDPITPPAYAERAALSYPNSRLLVAAAQGHGVVGRGCMPEVIADFVTTGTVEALDTSCLERMRGDAFFVDLLGPPP